MSPSVKLIAIPRILKHFYKGITLLHRLAQFLRQKFPLLRELQQFLQRKILFLPLPLVESFARPTFRLIRWTPETPDSRWTQRRLRHELQDQWADIYRTRGGMGFLQKGGVAGGLESRGMVSYATFVVGGKRWMEGGGSVGRTMLGESDRAIRVFVKNGRAFVY